MRSFAADRVSAGPEELEAGLRSQGVGGGDHAVRRGDFLGAGRRRGRDRVQGPARREGQGQQDREPLHRRYAPRPLATTSS